MTKTLLTHNGSFHYDEVLATAILLHIFADAEVIRTRDESKFEKADIVYDVGGIFDPARNRYDHHQNTFHDTFSEKYDVKLSSAGLIYKYFCNILFAKYNFTSENLLYEKIREKIYTEFFLYADAIDNGVDISGDIKPRTLSTLVAGFNVYHCEDDSKMEQIQNAKFMEALEIVKIDFLNYMNYIFNDYIPSYESAYKEIEQVTGDIYSTSLKVSSELIFDIDETLNKGLKFVIFKNKHDYRVLALRVSRDSFETRIPLAKAWRGLRGAELDNVSKIKGCTFVHATGFTGGNKTLEGAIAMCKSSIDQFVHGK